MTVVGTLESPEYPGVPQDLLTGHAPGSPLVQTLPSVRVWSRHATPEKPESRFLHAGRERIRKSVAFPVLNGLHHHCQRVA